MQAPPLPAIPAKRYFTIGEVSELCGVKPYVLRYWEQEFAQLRPMKRRGNRRYYQHHEVLLVRRIRELLYEQGFTINGARGRLSESAGQAGASAAAVEPPFELVDEDDGDVAQGPDDSDASSMRSGDGAATAPPSAAGAADVATAAGTPSDSALTALLRSELLLIRDLLSP
jgi:DNA-binding transcriptional MerR regulator